MIKKNIYYDDILLVNDPPINKLDCNKTSYYRVGGFKGSRNCKNGISQSNTFIKEIEINTTKNKKVLYTLKINADYINEWSNYNDTNLSFTFTNKSNNIKTNIKRIYIKAFKNKNVISSISYYKANIGHIQINKLKW